MKNDIIFSPEIAGFGIFRASSRMSFPFLLDDMPFRESNWLGVIKPLLHLFFINLSSGVARKCSWSKGASVSLIIRVEWNWKHILLEFHANV